MAIFMFDSHGLVVIVNKELLVQYYYTSTITNAIDIVSTLKKLGNCHN